LASWDSEFTAFAAARGPALYRYAYLLCGNGATAQDLTQSALARMYVAWPRLKRRGELDGYVRTVLTRAYVDERRKPWRREDPHAELSLGTVDPYGQVDERDRLMQALAALPRRQRAVVVLRIWHDLSVEQTAEALDVSVGTIKSQLARGLDHLRQTLAEPDEHPEEATR
jgi:RNA polymerase sigma-70 factor (sigma-E family)